MFMTARLTAIALTVAALAAAGCGADDPAPAASKPKPAGMSIQRCVTEVAGLGQSIDDARSDYLHAERTRAAVKHGTAEVQAATPMPRAGSRPSTRPPSPRRSTRSSTRHGTSARPSSRRRSRPSRLTCRASTTS